MNTRFLSIAIVFVFAALSGCANTKIANNDTLALAAQEEAAKASISSDDAIRSASHALTMATNEGLKFYAPLHMDKAQEKLEEAQKYNKKEATDENRAAALAAAITAEKLIDSAKNNRIIVEKQLALSLEHREVLLELGTPKALPKEYNKGMAMLDNLVREIEGGNMAKVTVGQAELLEYFAEIEADTLKVQWLTRAETMLDKATDADADNYAPSTYAKARQGIKRADDFIEKNYRDRDGVKQQSKEAYNLAAQAYFVALEAQKIYKANEEDVEKYILEQQALFDKINRHAKVEDLASYSFYEQTTQLENALANKANDTALTPTPVDKMDAVEEGEKVSMVQKAAESISEPVAADVEKVESADAETAEATEPSDVVVQEDNTATVADEDKSVVEASETNE